VTDELTPQGRFAEIAREDGRGAVVTILEGPNAGAKMLFEPDGSRRGSLGSPELDDEAARHADELMWSERSEQRGNLFVDVTYPAPRLIIFGAIDFAAQLCTLARTSGWRPYVVDPRGFFARPDRFPDAEEVVAAWPDEAFERIGGIERQNPIVQPEKEPHHAPNLFLVRSAVPGDGLSDQARGVLVDRETCLEQWQKSRSPDLTQQEGGPGVAGEEDVVWSIMTASFPNVLRSLHRLGRDGSRPRWSVFRKPQGRAPVSELRHATYQQPAPPSASGSRVKSSCGRPTPRNA